MLSNTSIIEEASCAQIASLAMFSCVEGGVLIEGETGLLMSSLKNV